MLLPERLTKLGQNHSLAIGQIVEQLSAEVKPLAQEKIVPDKKADDVQKQLSQLQKDSSSYDPNKTWEAPDHIKQANSDAAKQAAEAGMDAATASQAAQDLASMLNAAKLEEGILNGKNPAGTAGELERLEQGADGKSGEGAGVE